jgi:hypothetical protein
MNANRYGTETNHNGTETGVTDLNNTVMAVFGSYVRPENVAITFVVGLDMIPHTNLTVVINPNRPGLQLNLPDPLVYDNTTKLYVTKGTVTRFNGQNEPFTMTIDSYSEGSLIDVTVTMKVYSNDTKSLPFANFVLADTNRAGFACDPKPAPQPEPKPSPCPTPCPNPSPCPKPEPCPEEIKEISYFYHFKKL